MVYNPSMDDEINGFLVVNGNPFDGLVITGPFETSEDAQESAEFNNGTDAWIVPVYKPD